MTAISWIILGGWVIGNFSSIYLLAFTDVLIFRIAAWFWLSAALSWAGLVQVGWLDWSIPRRR